MQQHTRIHPGALGNPLPAALLLGAFAITGCAQGMLARDALTWRRSAPPRATYTVPRTATPAAAAPATKIDDYKNSTKSDEMLAPRSRGWRQLMYGDCVAAFVSFSREAQRSPVEASPKVGYALASAALGRHSTAIWAMRRAFDFDPEGVAYLRLGGWSDQPLENIVRQFERLRYASPDDPGIPFMIAAIRLLQDDPRAARAALQEMPESGWTFASAQRLSHLIDDRLAAHQPALAVATPPAPSGKQPSPPSGAAKSSPDEPTPAAPSAEAGAAPSASPPTPEPRHTPQTPEGDSRPRAPTPAAPAPATTQAAEPTEPTKVDFDALREGLREAGVALDAFTNHLIQLMERSKPATPISTARTPTPPPEP